MGNISGTTAARASKFCVVLWLKPSNIVLKFGFWDSCGSGMPKIKNLAKFFLDLLALISRTKTVMAKKHLYDTLTWTLKPFSRSWLALNNAQSWETAKINFFLKIEDISKTE